MVSKSVGAYSFVEPVPECFVAWFVLEAEEFGCLGVEFSVEFGEELIKKLPSVEYVCVDIFADACFPVLKK